MPDFESYTPEELLGPLNEVEEKNAPKELFFSGDLGLLRNGPRVSVVGSRKLSDLGKSRTRSLSRILVKEQAVVVSGLAEGVDTIAHETAIAAGGQTIAVLGTPLDQEFPAKNRELQRLIMKDHLAVSQFPVGSAGGRKNFPMRNRTMALLSDATVIVEAGEKSGTIHQGWEALRLGRPLFLLESLVSSGHKWVEEFLSYDAQVLTRDNIDFLLEFLPGGSRDAADSLAF